MELSGVESYSVISGTATIGSFLISILALTGNIPIISIKTLSAVGTPILFSINMFYIFAPIFVATLILTVYFLNKMGK